MKFFKKKRDGVLQEESIIPGLEEDAGGDSGSEKPEVTDKGGVRRKGRSLAVLSLFLMIATGYLVYDNLPSSKNIFKPLRGADNIKPAAPYRSHTAPFAGQPASPPATPIATATANKALVDKGNVVNETANAVNSNRGRHFTEGVKALYIPAKDILSGGSTAELQAQKEKNELLHEQVRAKKLQSDLKKLDAEIEIIPYQTNAQKKEIASKIDEKKNINPIELRKNELPLPTLLSVQKIADESMASFQMATGESIRAKVGDSVGDFMVKQIGSNHAQLEDKSGRTMRVTIKLPDRYPVSSSMFASKQSSSSMQQSPGVHVLPSQPAQIPIMPLGGSR